MITNSDVEFMSQKEREIVQAVEKNMNVCVRQMWCSSNDVRNSL